MKKNDYRIITTHVMLFSFICCKLVLGRGGSEWFAIFYR